LAVAESYAARLNLRIVSHSTSLGVAQSINDGIVASDSEFIARIDADDLAEPNRLQMQLDFMQANPRTGVVGTHMKVFSEEACVRKELFTLTHPKTNTGIRTALLQRCAVAHPSVLCRRLVFDQVGLYDARFDFCEDYDLWCRASLLGIQFANIPEPLTHYRRHPGQVSREKAQTQFEKDLLVKRRYMSAWLDGDDAGLMPEFLSLQTRFASREVAMNVIQQCADVTVRLGRRASDVVEYSSMVAGSISRHLNGS
jgi:glycosyltransferase involved in cell wall biosynthesis